MNVHIIYGDILIKIKADQVFDVFPAYAASFS